ncbi:MAG: ATP-binding cassette domain-containing protein [Bacteroidota bacterium]
MSIELNGIVLAYGEKVVLSQVNGVIQKGQITGILGPNGAGKTTLFKTLAGIKSAAEGSIQYNGQNGSAEQVAYMPTEPFFYPYMTGGEYLQLLGANQTMIEKLNAVFELPLDQYAQSYSTGMRKKLAFLGVVAMDRPILLLDEPFNGVDLEGNQMMLQLIQSMKSQKVILIASHLLEALLQMADVIYELRDHALSAPLQPEEFSNLKKRMQQKNKTAVEQIRNILSERER